MFFIAGSGMLFAAFLLVVVAHRLLNRPGAGYDPEAFGVSEAVSLVFTALVVFGVASLMHATIIGPLPATLAELGISIAVLVATCIVARGGLNRLFPRDLPAMADGPTAPANLRGRLGHEPRPVKPAGSKGRRAA